MKYLKHIETGKIFQNRKEAKDFFGHSKFNKLVKANAFDLVEETSVA